MTATTSLQQLLQRLRRQHVRDLQVYRSAHQDRRNRVLHWLLVPVECWSALAFLHWFIVTYVIDNILRVAMVVVKDIDGGEEGNGIEQQTVLVVVAIFRWLLSLLPALITVGLGVLSVLISSPPSSSPPPGKRSKSYSPTSTDHSEDNNTNGINSDKLRNRNGSIDDQTSTSNKHFIIHKISTPSKTSTKATITTATNAVVVGRLCFFFHIGCAWSFYRIMPPPPSPLLQQRQEEEEDDGEYYISKNSNNFIVLVYIVMAWFVAWTLQIVVGHWMWEQNQPNVSPSTLKEVSYLAMCQSVLIAWSS